nr:NAD(P)H-dependent oxidoreductase [Francisella tularensis]
MITKNIKTTLLDINDFEMPIYSIDRENTYGIHPLAYDFKKNVKGHDALIISLAEHNGATLLHLKISSTGYLELMMEVFGMTNQYYYYQPPLDQEVLKPY